MLIASYIIENDRKFAAAIDDAAAKVGDLRVAFTLIAKDWRKSNKSQFTLKGTGQYPDLSLAYAIRKARTHPTAPIMVRSGRLRDSVSGSLNSDSIQVISKDSLIMGTRVEYGIYHQSDEPRKKIPLRKFLFIGAEAPSTAPSSITGRTERFLSIINAEVTRKLKG